MCDNVLTVLLQQYYHGAYAMSSCAHHYSTVSACMPMYIMLRFCFVVMKLGGVCRHVYVRCTHVAVLCFCLSVSIRICIYTYILLLFAVMKLGCDVLRQLVEEMGVKRTGYAYIHMYIVCLLCSTCPVSQLSC